MGISGRMIVVTALGIAQILAWGSSFYFPAVFAKPIVADTGWPLSYVVGGTSIGLLVAGLISPRVGALIGRRGGRPVLAASSLIYAIGLAGIGLSPSLPVYLLSWVVLGVGMGMGLYDAAFAALGTMYGSSARGPITSITLFGGFASTICWPLSSALIEAFGWRAACLCYAVLHLAVALPLYLSVLSGRTKAADTGPALEMSEAQVRPSRHRKLLFLLIAVALSFAAGSGAILVVHLLIILEARGIDAAQAVWLGALFGPAQIAARIVERLFGHRYHPVWTLLACCLLMLAGISLLKVDLPIAALAIFTYGAGYGISWIARGTLPLALFGPRDYARVIGRLAFPSLIVQALAPAAGALMIEHAGVSWTLGFLVAIALINVGIAVAIALLARPSP